MIPYRYNSDFELLCNAATKHKRIATMLFTLSFSGPHVTCFYWLCVSRATSVVRKQWAWFLH